MNTYIFSNCAKSEIGRYEKNLVEKIPLDSRIVILNRGNIYHKVPSFRRYRNTDFIMRSCHTHGLTSFFGLDDIVVQGSCNNINNIILFDPRNSSSHIIIGTKNGPTKELDLPARWMTEYRVKTGGKDATTGYSAYYLVQDIYGIDKSDIILVNFYGDNDNSTYKDATHSWSYENQWISDKNRIFL